MLKAEFFEKRELREWARIFNGKPKHITVRADSSRMAGLPQNNGD
jgi:hypothetical protein